MAKGYSTDLRSCVVALVEAGDSRREVARLLDLAASTTIRWMDLWQTTGSVAAKPGTGHCRSTQRRSPAAAGVSCSACDRKIRKRS
jgi:transposase